MQAPNRPQGLVVGIGVLRKGRPHAGTQLYVTENDGLRLAVFAISATGVPMAR